MNEFLRSGLVIDLALSVLALELVALVSVRSVRSTLRPLDVIGQLLAGALLLLAVRCALSGADYRWTLGFLSASFPAHMFDLLRRVRGARPTGTMEAEPSRTPIPEPHAKARY